MKNDEKYDEILKVNIFNSIDWLMMMMMMRNTLRFKLEPNIHTFNDELVKSPERIKTIKFGSTTEL